MTSCGGFTASSRDANCALIPLTENRTPYDVFPAVFTDDTGNAMSVHAPATGEELVARMVTFHDGCEFQVTVFSTHVSSSG